MLRMKSEQQVKRPTLMYFNTDTNSSRKTHHSIYGSAMKSNSSFSLSNNEKPREQCDEMTITQSSYNIERRMRKPLFKCVCIFVLTRRLFQRGFVMSGRQFCHIQISHRNPLFSFRVIKYKASRDGQRWIRLKKDGFKCGRTRPLTYKNALLKHLTSSID